MESIYRQARKKLHGCQGPRLKILRRTEVAVYLK